MYRTEGSLLHVYIGGSSQPYILKKLFWKAVIVALKKKESQPASLKICKTFWAFYEFNCHCVQNSTKHFQHDSQRCVLHTSTSLKTENFEQRNCKHSIPRGTCWNIAWYWLCLYWWVIHSAIACIWDGRATRRADSNNQFYLLLNSKHDTKKCPTSHLAACNDALLLTLIESLQNHSLFYLTNNLHSRLLVAFGTNLYVVSEHLKRYKLCVIWCICEYKSNN